MFFKKNPNESDYVHEKKHWTDVIKNSGNSNLLLWRQPEEDFNTNSTLIVMPGERAIFVKGGKIEEVFEAGTYQLTTDNYPFISRLKNAFSGGISVFNCVVYFVRDVSGYEIKWGTDSPINVRDNILGIATKLRARGAYKVKIDNPVTFLTVFSGSTDSVTQDSLKSFFKEEFLSTIKSNLSNYLQEREIELLGIDSKLEELSNNLTPNIAKKLLPYGLKLQKFSISAIDIEDSQLRQRFDNVGMSAYEKIRNAQSDKAVLETLGTDWQKIKSVDIMREMAKNGSTIGADIGTGLGSIGAFATVSQSVITEPTLSAEDPVVRLEKLKKMLDIGLITQKEFDSKKVDILKNL